MKKKLKDTKIGKFIADKAPQVLDVVDDFFPPAKILTQLVEPTLSEDDKLAFRSLILEYQKEEEIQVSNRHEKDMSSDSWLSKNVRPITLIFLSMVVTALAIADASSLSFTISAGFVSLFTASYLTVLAFYFGGREWQKSIINKKK